MVQPQKTRSEAAKQHPARLIRLFYNSSDAPGGENLTRPARRKGPRTSQIVVESALTKPLYAWILLLLGVRSWGFVLLFAVLVFLVWTSVNTGNYSLLLIYAPVLVVVYGGAVTVSVLAKKNRRAYSPVRYTFEETRVMKESSASSQTLRWDAFVRWRRIGPYYLIYQSKRSFFVVPRAKIPPDQMQAFEDLLGRKLQKRRT